MLQTRCIKIKLKPGKVRRARDWAAEINRRKSEAFRVMHGETVFIECAFLDSTSEGDFLIYFMKVWDLTATQSSSPPEAGSISAFHEDFKAEAWESGKRLETLIDLDRTADLAPGTAPLQNGKKPENAGP